jgi:hypothetical protein
MRDLYDPQRDTERALQRCRTIARAQLGLITRDQAMTAGVSPTVIKSLCKRSHWQRKRRNVYCVGAAPRSVRQDRLSACLSYGRGAYLSGFAAADEWDFDGCRNNNIHLTTTRSLKRRDDDVVIHRTRWLPRHHVCGRGRMPITTPLRTLLDIASALTLDEFQFPFEDVLRRGLVKPEALVRLLQSGDHTRSCGDNAAAQADGRRAPAHAERFGGDR